MPARTPTDPTPDPEPGEPRDLERARRGDAGAFERLYRGHVARVHSLARRMLGPADADEATQDVFVLVWRKLEGFQGEAKFSTWLHRVAVNAILSRRRRLGHEGARRVAEPAREERAAPEPGGAGDAEALRVVLDAAIERLPHGAREVFVLHDVEGRRHADVAALLGIEVGTSKSQLHRARMLLRRHLSARREG